MDFAFSLDQAAARKLLTRFLRGERIYCVCINIYACIYTHVGYIKKVFYYVCIY